MRRSRGRRGSLFHLFGWGRGKGRVSGRQRHQEMMGVRKQEAIEDMDVISVGSALATWLCRQWPDG